MVKTGSFSFEGLHRTTGFHPLWQMILVAAAALVRDERALLYACLLIAVLLVFVTGLYCCTAISKHSLATHGVEY